MQKWEIFWIEFLWDSTKPPLWHHIFSWLPLMLGQAPSQTSFVSMSLKQILSGHKSWPKAIKVSGVRRAFKSYFKDRGKVHQVLFLVILWIEKKKKGKTLCYLFDVVGIPTKTKWNCFWIKSRNLVIWKLINQWIMWMGFSSSIYQIGKLYYFLHNVIFNIM